MLQAASMTHSCGAFVNSGCLLCVLGSAHCFPLVLSFASLGRNTLKNPTVCGVALTPETSQSLLSLFLSKIVLVWILMLTNGLNPRITCWVGIWSIQNFRSLTCIFKTQKPFVICGAGPEISIYEDYMQQALLPRKAERDKQYLMFDILYRYLITHWVTYSHSSVSTGHWVQDPLWVPQSVDTHVPCIKWHRTVGPLYQWMGSQWLWRASSICGEGDGTPLQYSCLENPMDGGTGRLQSMGSWKSDTFTFHFQALEKEMATHSSVLAWRIPRTGEPGGLPSMGSHRVGHDLSDLVAAAAVSDPISGTNQWMDLWEPWILQWCF